MFDDVSDIRNLYDSGPEVEAARLQRHQLEHDLTCRILRRYLPPKGMLLEIGAGTGAYTVNLLRQGYAVTAVDLAEGVLNTARAEVEKAGVGEKATFLVADARDLGGVTEDRFDAVLLMGPLYHLVLEDDRRLALRQARSKLRSGGVLFSAHICRHGIMGTLMRKIPDWILRRDEVESIMQTGRDPEGMPKGGFRGYYATVEEIRPLHESEGFDSLFLGAVEPFIGPYDECYNELKGEMREAWLDMAERLSEQPSIVGASCHLLYVGKHRR